MKKVFSSVLAVLFVFSVAQAQEVTINDIVDNYLENIGGADAWKEVKSMKMTGTTATQMGAFPIEVLSMTPNMNKITVEVQGMTLIPMAFDGESAWGLNPFGGDVKPTKMPDEVANEMKKQPFESEFIDYGKKGIKLELLGTKEIEGTETYEVKMVTAAGDEKFYYFDMENFVPIMMKQTASTGPMKGQAMETYMSDYQEVEGLMIPFSMEQKAGEQVIMEMTAEKIELNVADMDAEVFMMPKQ
ncbi:MAG: hypothetical protein AAGI23_22895 [Bacteroidota bacterium]